MVQPKRPANCPLFLHRNNQWAKKVRGRLRYFGSDLDAALARWAEEKDHLLAGLEPPPRKSGKPSLSELANLYLADCRSKAKSGEVRNDQPNRVEAVLGIAITSAGGHARPDLLTVAQWQKVRQAMGTKLDGDQVSPETLKNRLARLRAFLNWCRRSKLTTEVDTGDALQPPAKHLMRRARNERGKRLWSREDLLSVIESASPLFRPVLLLGINAAMGAADIGLITRSQWSGQEFLDCPRHKTGIERRIWIWPETREALKVAIAKRPDPAKQKYRDRLLLTGTGRPWHVVEGGSAKDNVKQHLHHLKQKAKVTNGTFYDLRRTFRTIASECCDLEAVNLTMGHEGQSEGSTYLQEISDERIKRVGETVRNWLYG